MTPSRVTGTAWRICSARPRGPRSLAVFRGGAAVPQQEGVGTKPRVTERRVRTLPSGPPAKAGSVTNLKQIRGTEGKNLLTALVTSHI